MSPEFVRGKCKAERHREATVLALRAREHCRLKTQSRVFGTWRQLTRDREHATHPLLRSEYAPRKDLHPEPSR